MIDVVLFDLMGTVLYDPYLEALEAATGMDLAATAAVRNPQSWPDFERGRIDEAGFVEAFFAPGSPDHRFDIDAFHKVRREGYRYLPGMERLLDRVGGQVGRYIASNYPIWIDQMRADFGFDRYFEGIFASCHMGVRKPEPEFFATILDELDVPAERTLLVDDRKVNCEAAAALGLRTHVFEGAHGLAQRLQAEGLPA